MLDGSKIREKAPVLYGIIDRLLRYPTYAEAMKLKDLTYDQNFGGTDFTDMINENDLQNALRMGIEEYYTNVYENKVIWKSGMNVILDPLFYMEKLNLIRGGFKAYSWQKIVKKAIEKAQKSNSKVILVGAGTNLRNFLYLFSAMDKLNLIESIWDNSDEKQGALYCDLAVTKPNSKVKGIFVCTVENIGIEKILYDQIMKLCGENIDFYGLGFNKIASEN